ncbi:hypothetical protein [uncultured Aquimonas sp.]|uniref:hypothetical protein n=1 Tax=uncultured Aquimonas sp. TaxID=385483 RepID=UPI00086857E2|nr:hypothetical protein [uncultured Aquimonas sp.]ODU41226.1 MAG: hypothetical protein ABS96_32375 [Xanthomonadaceae bacterium SCN 69-123]
MKSAGYDLQAASPQPGLSLAPPDSLPALASGQEFARLLNVSQPLVSRWRSEGRLCTDARGNIDVPGSLVRLSNSLDPGRGGRKGTQRNGGTLDRIADLIRRYAGAAGSQPAADEREALRARVAELEDALSRVRNTWTDEQAASLAHFLDLLAADLPRLAALDRETAEVELDALASVAFYGSED